MAVYPSKGLQVVTMHLTLDRDNPHSAWISMNIGFAND